MEAINVSQLNRYLKSRIESDQNLKYIAVKGELSNFTNHLKSGHFYFSLKSETASVRAVMFKSDAQLVKFKPEDGMKVVVEASVRVFERDGIYQLYCTSMEQDGTGELYAAFEQLKKKLAAEGLFAPEHKKPIPAMPATIAVVTSKTGAALQDIINILSRRYPIARLVVVPALVQGENAPKSIVDGIKAACEKEKPDVLIVGRGGGSAEDLWCFNDETVARAIYDCPVPVISAVGHEIDFTIADFVADLRAPTPSAAAELCSPDISALYDRVNGLCYSAKSCLTAIINKKSISLGQSMARLKASSPASKIAVNANALGEKEKRLKSAVNVYLQAAEARLVNCVSTMEALSPLKVLTRGYSITYNQNGDIIYSAKSVRENDTVKTLLKDGEIISTVSAVNIKENENG